jgi:hypothetical protein
VWVQVNVKSGCSCLLSALHLKIYLLVLWTSLTCFCELMVVVLWGTGGRAGMGWVEKVLFIFFGVHTAALPYKKDKHNYLKGAEIFCKTLFLSFLGDLNVLAF